ncbi:hypothetical protein GJ496_006277 [Pomphorhynchus laevis]|nr:hypothetical protein GJ496_006277 [Pomphorhynchus laevis]
MDCPVNANNNKSINGQCSFDFDMLREWLQTCLSYDQVKHLSSEFASLNSNKERFKFCQQSKPVNSYVDHVIRTNNMLSPLYFSKNVDESTLCRDEGITLYRKHNLNEALRKFSKAILIAPPSSIELLKGYANRSACLFEMGHYSECVADINTATQLKTSISSDMKARLENRLLRCKQLMPSLNASTSDSSSDGVSSLTIIEELCRHRTRVNMLGLRESVSLVANDNDHYGRYIRANRDIKPGEIILVEKAFASNVISDYFDHYCDNCFEYLPLRFEVCEHCRNVVYCTSECRSKAWIDHHNLECAILGRHIHNVVSPMKHLALRAAIYSNFQKSNEYKLIKSLRGNDESRTKTDLFWRSCVALYLFRIISDSLDRKCSSSKLGVRILNHMLTFPCNAHELIFFWPPSYDEQRNGKGICEMVQHECGAGIFYFLSMFNHSCNPSENRFLINIHFSNMQNSNREERQDALYEQYKFKCQCTACIENWAMITELSEQDPPKCTQSECSICRRLDRIAKTDIILCSKMLIDNTIAEREKHNAAWIIKTLTDFISECDDHIQLPWFSFCRAQEALKQCFNCLTNKMVLDL